MGGRSRFSFLPQSHHDAIHFGTEPTDAAQPASIPACGIGHKQLPESAEES
jgi:hypothetical protein